MDDQGGNRLNGDFTLRHCRWRADVASKMSSHYSRSRSRSVAQPARKLGCEGASGLARLTAAGAQRIRCGACAHRVFYMLRKIIYATLFVIPITGAVSAQTDLKDIQSGENSLRTEQEKKTDRAVDRAYESTIKRLPDQEKKKTDPWGDVRPTPPAAAKNKQ
jgi:hypothetical protein